MHTERLDVDWIVRFVRFHGMQLRNDLVPAEPELKPSSPIWVWGAWRGLPTPCAGSEIPSYRQGTGRAVCCSGPDAPVDPPAGLIRRHHSDPSVMNKASGSGSLPLGRRSPSAPMLLVMSSAPTCVNTAPTSAPFSTSWGTTTWLPPSSRPTSCSKAARAFRVR